MASFKTILELIFYQQEILFNVPDHFGLGKARKKNTRSYSSLFKSTFSLCVCFSMT